jgi:hypothetical protein
MATSSSLIKTMLHRSLAEGVYRDIVTRSANYYYYLGKTLTWDDETNPELPLDTYDYERAARSDIITMKQIRASDVSFVVDRINWEANAVYDMYDDRYGDEVIGLDIIDGGTGYTSLPTITLTGGGGTGASFSPIVFDGQIIGIDDLDYGYGYTSKPTVTVTGGGGTGAVLEAVVNVAPSGSQKLEECNYYVVTDEFNVYKCLDNNNGAKSTEQPIGSSVEPITTADGYIWKYMYNVPINLRNKFLTESHMPVVSALTNQFYSGGTLDTIVINNKGSGYTFANISVVGDGYLEADPTYLTSVAISNGGTGYSSPVIAFGDPFDETSQFLSNSSMFRGQKIFTADGDFYECTAPGTLSAVAPTHRFGTVANGTASLKYIGTRVSGTPVVNSDGELESVTLNGSVREVTMVDGGSGYTSAPSVNFSGGGGTGAAGVAKLGTNGQVLYVTVTNPGNFDYTSNPTVTFGEEWEANTAYTLGEQVFNGDFIYTCTSAGTSSNASDAAGPVHTTGAVTEGTVEWTYAGERATGSVIRRFGAGYSAAPTITISEATGSGAAASFLTSKSEARLLPIIEDGQIISVITVEGGIGYSAATITVSGDGTGSSLSPDLSIGNINSLQANNEILVTAGQINAIKVISGGYGYGTAPITIEGDGTGATAEATIDGASGKITKITMTNTGENYTFANIVIGGNGKGAKLRAIIGPEGGHGKNSPEELFARTLMFYSNVSTDLNQGVSVNNDYRQIGIIKNPKEYGDNVRFTGIIGSGCYLIEGVIDTNNFAADDDITLTRTYDGFYDTDGVTLKEYKRLYRIVTVSSDSALIQSLDNDEPQINDTFSKVVESGTPPTFTAVSVTLPTVDKYSGQMMFIDNKAGFTPSEDETVTLRTVLTF